MPIKQTGCCYYSDRVLGLVDLSGVVAHDRMVYGVAALVELLRSVCKLAYRPYQSAPQYPILASLGVDGAKLQETASISLARTWLCGLQGGKSGGPRRKYEHWHRAHSW